MGSDNENTNKYVSTLAGTKTVNPSATAKFIKLKGNVDPLGSVLKEASNFCKKLFFPVINHLPGGTAMSDFTKTVKFCLHTEPKTNSLFQNETIRYASACDYVSGYIFNSGFQLSCIKLHNILYNTIRKKFGLKSQMAQSVFKTVVARYKSVRAQMAQSPYRIKDESGKCYQFARNLEWLERPIRFSRPQIDLVRGRDYSFLKGNTLSINTLEGREKVFFDLPDCFKKYFDGSWKFGTAKLVSMNKKWYLHVSVTKDIPDMDISNPAQVTGNDRGLRFLLTTYDDNGKTTFIDGKDIMAKREQFRQTRAELQSKNTKSAKRILKRLSGRENRWMSDVNHQVSKALVQKYGPGTLHVFEDLSGVSFSENSLSKRDADGRSGLRSWAFYQLGQFTAYKAREIGSATVEVPADYTSQRCPKCGRIHKENRDHDTHEYTCDKCGYHSNDDRVAGMNIHTLGRMLVSGIAEPCFKKEGSNIMLI